MTARRVRRGRVAYLSSVLERDSGGVTLARGVRRSVVDELLPVERRAGLMDTDGQRPSSTDTGGVRPRDALRASVRRGTCSPALFVLLEALPQL